MNIVLWDRNCTFMYIIVWKWAAWSNSQEYVLHWNERSSSSAPCPEPSEEPRWTWTDWQNRRRWVYRQLSALASCRDADPPSYLVDISKRSLTELTLQPVAPHRSSSCSQSEAESNQFMRASRRRLLRNCFISGGGKLKRHVSRGLNSCQTSFHAWDAMIGASFYNPTPNIFTSLLFACLCNKFLIFSIFCFVDS